MKHFHGTFKHAEHSHVKNDHQGINSGGKAWKNIRCKVQTSKGVRE